MRKYKELKGNKKKKPNNEKICKIWVGERMKKNTKNLKYSKLNIC